MINFAWAEQPYRSAHRFEREDQPMKTVVFAAVVSLFPIASLGSPAFAAAAHNVQKGTDTTNTNDDKATEQLKQDGSVDASASNPMTSNATPMRKMKKKRTIKSNAM